MAEHQEVLCGHSALSAACALVASAQPRMAPCAPARATIGVRATPPAGLEDADLAWAASTLTPASWLGSTLSVTVVAAGSGGHPDVFSSSPAWTAVRDHHPELRRPLLRRPSPQTSPGLPTPAEPLGRPAGHRIRVAGTCLLSGYLMRLGVCQEQSLPDSASFAPAWLPRALLGNH